MPWVQLAPGLRSYHRAWLAKDLVGGLATGAVVVPQAMAYATIAGLPIEVGLYTCMVPMAVYALLGGSRTLSVSTTSTVAVLTASTLLAADVASDSDYPVRDLATLTVLVGLVLLGTRLLHLGSVIDNISEATLAGVKVGVGLTVAVDQLPKLLGVEGDPDADSFFAALRGVLGQAGDADGATVALSAVTLVVLVGQRRLAPRVPGPLLAVALGITLAATSSIGDDVALVGKVPAGLPAPVMPSLEHVGALLPGAFAIAVLVFLETVAVGRSVRRPDEPPIDNDAELTAVGVACVAGGLFRAMPSAGGFSQTAINQRAGARTQLSELVTVALAVSAALFLGSLLAKLPEATLAALVTVAVAGLVDPAELRALWRANRFEFWVAAVTAGFGLLAGMLAAVLVGVLLTLVVVLVELDRAGVTELEVDRAGDLVPSEETTRPVPGLLVLRFDAPLYTANVRGVARKVLAAVEGEEARPDVMLLDATVVGLLSTTVAHELAELSRELRARGVTLWLAGLPPRALETARRLPRWEAAAQAGRMHPTARAAVAAYESGRAETGPGRPGRPE